MVRIAAALLNALVSVLTAAADDNLAIIAYLKSIQGR
jgi:hypothetical protein